MPVPFSITGTWPGAVVTVQDPDLASHRLTAVGGLFSHRGDFEPGSTLLVHIHQGAQGWVEEVVVPVEGGQVDLTPEGAEIVTPTSLYSGTGRAREIVSHLDEAHVVRRAVEALADAIEERP